MKKNTFILMAMATIFGLSSCDKELFSTENTNKTFTLFATTETGTKTALSWNDQEEHYDVVWSKGDQFTVFSFTTPVINCGEFTLTDGDAGKTSGTFVGEELNATKQYIAYYPATNAETILKATSTWPTNQTYHGENNITGCPMVSEIFKVSAPFVKFTNLGGILRLTVKNEEKNVSIKKITVCADQLESPITLDCSNNEGRGVAFTADSIEFNIAMPSYDGIEEGSSKDTLASYSNVSIYLTDTNGKVCCKSLQSGVKLDIVRSKITKASFSVNSKDFYSCTTGSKVTFGGHEGIVVDLGGTLGKVIVATMNVGATSVNEDGCLGTPMTYGGACAAWSGWRLPTVGELTAFCDPGYHGVCGNTEFAAGCTGAMMWDFDENEEIDLYLPLSEMDKEEGRYPCDKYWTGPADNDGKYFYFVPEIDWDGWGGNTYYPIGYDYREPYNAAAKTSEFLVRLFHDLP